MGYEDFDAMIGDDNWLRDSPLSSTQISKPLHKRHPDAFTIDDLLKDHYKERSKTLERMAKRSRLVVPDSESDEECDPKTEKELQFEELVESCQKQVQAEGGTLEVPKWGEKLFYAQRTEKFVIPKIKSPIVRTFLAASEEISKQFPVQATVNEQTPEDFMLQFLRNGWVHLFAHNLDSDMLDWIFHTMIYTGDKNVERSACHLLCDIIQKEIQDFSWLPSYKSIIEIFEAYGHVRSVTFKNMRKEGPVNSMKGPPQNLESLLCFLTAAFKKRHLHSVYSRMDIEELVVMIASFSLDRSILKFNMLIRECLNSMLNSFTEAEWSDSRHNISTLLTRETRLLVNSLRLMHSLQGRESRMKSLQSLVALYFFSKVTNIKTTCAAWEILSVFRETDVKRKVENFEMLYFQISMADVWFWSNAVFESDKAALESWLLFLKSCSFQISSTDWRPYATKVRNQATYLLQVYQSYCKDDVYEES